MFQRRTGPRSCLTLARWAGWSGVQVGRHATSNVKEGQTTYPINRGRVWMEGREGSKGQSYKEEDREMERGGA